MKNYSKIKKKLKICFIDIPDRRRKNFPEQWETPYSTFIGYDIDKVINSRVTEIFGWSTDLEELINNHSIDLSIQIINLEFLEKKGIVQEFHSKHGKKFDDTYSYLEGMNVLVIEGSEKNYLKGILERLETLFTSSKILVYVDQPKLVILIPNKHEINDWNNLLANLNSEVLLCSDIRELLHNFNFVDFIDYSLSSGYKSKLEEYVILFEKIRQALSNT